MLYFEDIEIEAPAYGGTYELDEAEIVEFATKWDPLPLHTNKSEAEKTIFGGLTASGLHLTCILSLCSHGMADQAVVIAGLGTESRIQRPGRPGDVLTFVTRAEEKRESQSRPNAGIVVYRHELKNQHGDTVLETKVTLLVEKRPD